LHSTGITRNADSGSAAEHVEGNCNPTPRGVFDEVDQFVDVSPGSAHQYIAPGQGDIRAPCPGLNAAANHGFLPHNGVPSITQSKIDLFSNHTCSFTNQLPTSAIDGLF
jgi:hypothetical protein